MDILRTKHLDWITVIICHLVAFFTFQEEEKKRLETRSKQLDQDLQEVTEEIQKVTGEYQDADKQLVRVSARLKECVSQQEPIQVTVENCSRQRDSMFQILVCLFPGQVCLQRKRQLSCLRSHFKMMGKKIGTHCIGLANFTNCDKKTPYIWTNFSHLFRLEVRVQEIHIKVLET